LETRDARVFLGVARKALLVVEECFDNAANNDIHATVLCLMFVYDKKNEETRLLTIIGIIYE
jgi:hypothetical protein